MKPNRLPIYTSKKQIITAIRSERQKLEGTLHRLSEDQLTLPNVEGNWSVKDVLAHITFWEKRMVQWINEATQNLIPEIPASWDDVHRLNNQNYQNNRDTPLLVILEEFKQSFTKVIEVVDEISKEDLIKPERYSWRKGNPLWNLVAENTWRHYREHNETINNKFPESE